MHLRQWAPFWWWLLWCRLAAVVVFGLQCVIAVVAEIIISINRYRNSQRKW